MSDDLSKIVPHPYEAYVELDIGGTNIILQDNKPQYLLAFRVERFIGAAGFYYISLFDKTWTTIENLLLKASNIEVKIRYGYVNVHSEQTYISDFAFTTAAEVTSSFHNDGVQIDLKLTSAITNSMQLRPTSINIHTDKISDIINALNDLKSQLNGYKVIVEETGDHPAREAIDSTDLDQKIFCQSNDTVLNFVNKLLPLMTSKDATQNDYTWWIDDKKKEFHVEPISKYLSDTQKTYTYIRDKHTEVISWNPTMSYPLVINYGGSQSSGGSTDDVNGRQRVVTANTKDTGAKYMTGRKVEEKRDVSGAVTNQVKAPEGDPLKTKGDIKSAKQYPGSDTDNNAFKHLEGGAFMGNEEQTANAVLLNQSFILRTQSFGGTLVIHCDPTIEMIKPIKILAITPNGDNHYSSGIYAVLGITDELNVSGRMTTTLKVNRLTTLEGSEDSVGKRIDTVPVSNQNVQNNLGPVQIDSSTSNSGGG